MIDLDNENWVEGFAKAAAEQGLTADETKTLMWKAAQVHQYTTNEDFKEGFDKEANRWAKILGLGGKATTRPSATSAMLSGAGQAAGGALRATGAMLPRLPDWATGGAMVYGGMKASDKVKDMLENYNLGPRERQLKQQLNSISGLSPEARILATEQLRKANANYYKQMHKRFGGGNSGTVTRQKYY